MQNKNQFTEGPILKPLVRFTLPIILALLLQAMYGAVDLLVVGQFAGDPGSVSAVSTGSTMMNLPMMIIFGLTMGATVLIGRKIGEKNYQEAGDIIGASVALFASAALLFTALMLIFLHPFAQIMRVPPEAYDSTIRYVTICAWGTIFIVAYNVLSGIFRGLGNSTLPLVFVAIACAVNIAGDLLLVAVFHLGAAGAAIATVLAQAVSVALSLVIIARTDLPFRFRKSSIRFNGAYIAQIMRLGSPIALQDVLTNLSFLVVNAIINNMGVVTSAGYGIAQKVTGFILLIPSAFGSSMSAFVAQNIGARKPERAKRALFTGMSCALAVGVFMFLLSFFNGTGLSAIFTQDPAVIAASAEYLKGFSFDCLMTCMLFCFTGYFNGCGSTMFVMAQGLVGALLVRMPVAYLMSVFHPTLFAIGLATPLASLVSIILCTIYYRRKR
ncbi:MAG: MATE family efflux transporter [Clostridia bacterium]|nr:MATE family efflux transporter [Clostridia bacterium]MBQ8972889.1 MATE family efflux transporter [Clostridia bacterium]